MNFYHHAAGDGTSGPLMMTAMMENYNILLSGGSLDTTVTKPLPSIEDMTAHVKNDDVLKSLIDAKIERCKTYKPYSPFDLNEMAANHSEKVPQNLTLYQVGTEENMKAMKERCKKEGVTLNSLALAAGYLAMAAVDAENILEDVDNVDGYRGLKGQLIDIPVNMRHRIDPGMAGKHVGFIITEITTKV